MIDVNCTAGVAAGGNGTSEADEADRRSLSLLNKLIGAQILVQCTESAFAAAAAPPEDAKSTSFHETSQHRSADGSVSHPPTHYSFPFFKSNTSIMSFVLSYVSGRLHIS